MQLRAICFLTVWACAFLATCVMAAPSGSSGSEDSAVLDEASQITLGLESIIDSIGDNFALGGAVDDDSDQDDDDEEDGTFARRRRILSGVHSKLPGSGRRFRNSRPRVFVPRRRHGSRSRSRNNVSPY